jgi:hypothetical protein
MSNYSIIYDSIALDIPDKEPIPITKQVNEVGDLNVFKSDFSREFRIKRTRAMEALFENASLINSETKLLYSKLDVRVYANGLDVLPRAKLSVNRVDNLYYYCNVYSGAKMVFDILREKTIGTIDLDLSHEWNNANAKTSIVNNLDYQYLLADYSDDGELVDDATNAPALTFQCLTLRACIRLTKIFEKIFTGYGLENDADDDVLFKKIFLPIASLTMSAKTLQPYLVQYRDMPATNSMAINILEDYKVYDPYGVIIDNQYEARLTGTFFFWIAHPRFLAPTGVIGKVAGITVTEDLGYNLWGYFVKAELTVGQRITFSGTGSIGFNFPYSFYCYNIDSARIGITSTYNPVDQLPPISQADLVKAVCQVFGLVPDYDSLTETVKLWSINKVKENIPIAKNWSRYLSIQYDSMEFRLNYARINNIKYKDDKDVGEGSGNAAIYIADENLEREKDLYNLPFACCDTAKNSTEELARIGWYESVEGTAEYKELEKITARIVTREDMTLGAVITDGVGSETLTDAEAKKAFPIDLAVSLGYNQALIDMLDKTKVLRVQMNLNEREINEMDHSIPIYLKHFSAYFFVKKISNWISGRPCDVELIRI